MCKYMFASHSVTLQVAIGLSVMVAVAGCGDTVARDAVGGDDAPSEGAGASEPSTPSAHIFEFPDGPCVDPLVEVVPWEQVPSSLDLAALEDPIAMDAVWVSNGVDAGVHVEYVWDTDRSVRAVTYPDLDTAYAAQCKPRWRVPAQVTVADQAGVIGPVSFGVDFQVSATGWVWVSSLDGVTSEAFFTGPVPGDPPLLGGLTVGVMGGDGLYVETRPGAGTPGTDAGEVTILHPAR